jgi:RHS repeat-associated protein
MTPYAACSISAVRLNRSRYTGKERDAESGNDYFEARYYSSAMGRFLSPDWSAKEEPIPYAKLDDPQSLNLYAYVQNNPLIRADEDGHDWGDALDFAVGVAKGVASSVSFGLVGAPSANDSAASLSGQLTGSLAVTHISATALEASGPTAVGGLVAAPETGGASLVVSAGAGATALVSSGTLAGGAKNVAAVAMAAKAGGRFSPGTKQAAKQAAGGKCQNCGTETTPGQKSQKGVTPPKNEGQTDHIQPASKGGTNDPSNAQHLCRECNIKKSNN